MKWIQQYPKSVLLLFALLFSMSLFAESNDDRSSSHHKKHKNKPLKWFVVVYENATLDVALADPNFADFAAKGTLFTNFHAVAHPSQPNYLALIAGDTFCCDSPLETCPGEPVCPPSTTLPFCTDNDVNFPTSIKTIVDLLEAKGLSWKVYCENLPSPGYTGSTALEIDFASVGNVQNCACAPATCSGTKFGQIVNTQYARKHNPFVSFQSIIDNSKRAAKIVNATKFFEDVKNGTLPDYIFYVPNQTNDGHDTSIIQASLATPCIGEYASTYAGEEFKRTFTLPFADKKFLKDRVVAVVFDEGDEPICSPNPNQIYCVFFGKHVKKGAIVDTNYNHYNLLRTIEHTMGIGNLGRNDATAEPMKGWQKKK